MTDSTSLGRRIKKVREELHLTLKAIEAQAGISATHISEIERGKTSPTIGALVRIAGVLGRDPSYFIEEEELADVSLVTAENRVSESLPGAAGLFDRLTTGITGGRMQAVFIDLNAGKSHRTVAHTHEGSEAALVLSGRVRFVVDGESHELEEGDAIVFDASRPHSYGNPARTEPAAMLWFSTRRAVE